MTTPTQNNIPSSTAIDARFNAEKLDEIVNSDNETYADRFGVNRFTLKGLAIAVQSFLSSLGTNQGAGLIGTNSGQTVQTIIGVSDSNMREHWRRLLDDVNLTLADGSFEEGGVINSSSTVLWYKAGNNCYTWNGSLPKTIQPGTLPSSDPNFVVVQNSSFRGSMRAVTPQMFGARPDYNTTTFEGTDNTQAFRNAIAFAISQDYQEVLVPAGRYIITDELNLGGVGVTNNRFGVKLRGVNWTRSLLIFKAPALETPCISIIGGSGNDTSKGVFDIGIIPHPSTDRQGIGLLLRNTCFAHVNEFNFRNLYIGVRLENYSTAGSFTEFCYLNNGRLFQNRINIQFNRTGSGDNSFHGNNFQNIQNQIDKNGGIGVQVQGNGGTCYLYNQYWQMQFFGGTDCVAFDLQGCNTDYVGGKLTAEGTTILRSDANSNFEFHGPYHSISTVSWDVPTETTRTQGRFTFRNTASKDNVPFTNSKMPTDSKPRILPSDLADRQTQGLFPTMFRVYGSNLDSLGFSVYDYAGNAFYFGAVGYQKSLQDFSPRFWFGVSGGTFTTASTSYTMKLYDSGAGIYFSPTELSPLISAGMSLGTSDKSFASGYFVNWIIGTNMAPRTTNTLTIGDDARRVKDIFLTNSPNVTSDGRKKTTPRNLTDKELECFYRVSKLPFIWKWLKDYVDDQKLHSGPVVQDVIKIMEECGLSYEDYAFIRYDAETDLFSLVREDLIFLILSAISYRQEQLDKRIAELENK